MSNTEFDALRKVLAHDLMQVYVRLILLLAVVWFSAETFAPFLPLMLWALILAVSLNPLNQWLSHRLHIGGGKSAFVLVALGLIIGGVPAVLLGLSSADYLREWIAILSERSVMVPEANPQVAAWPLVGPALYELWQSAHEDLMSAAKIVQPQLLTGGKVLLGAVANTLLALVLFFIALLIAGFMMAYAEQGAQQARRMLATFADAARGEEIQDLVVATVRSVSNGVVGVAFLQALALGIGFLILGVPAAGVLAFLVLFLGVLQLPSSIVVLPVIAWIWLVSGIPTIAATLGSFYLIAAGLADGLLRPYLLGRGVETPMPVVLIGALGGMAAEGLIGLFVGAVALSVGYKLLMSWVEHSVSEQQVLEANVGSSDD
ncbi:MAG: AI-2E family transporter [Halieaceae bacterium]|nr:AI-2E family transporter [Halieaceae bacterium]|tara:strand:+ start:2564 stop:3688 length:1125 start_codon:yes stop_codon:yes gene_type:complete